MDNNIENHVFDYQFLARSNSESGVFKANINAFYGPWTLNAFNNGDQIINEITNSIGCDISYIPMGLTIAVYQEDGGLKEYWWYGTRNKWVEKLGGNGSGSGSTPVQDMMQVYAANNYFNIPVNADRKCGSAVLRRTTTTTLQVIYNGNVLTQSQSDNFQIQLVGDSKFKINKYYDSTAGIFYIYLDFAASQDVMQVVEDQNISLVYKYEACSGIIPFSINTSKSSLAYLVNVTPESIYIPDTGVIPSIYIDVDAFDPYDNETHSLPDSVSVKAEYAHIQDDKYVRNEISILKIDTGTGMYLMDGDSQITIDGKTLSLQQVFSNTEFNEKYLKTGECVYINIFDEGVLQEKQEMRIVRSSSIIGPAIKQYDVSMQDEFITVPSSWVGKTDEKTIYNIKMRTRNIVSVSSIGEVSDVTIKNINCQQGTSSIYAITEDLDDTMTFKAALDSGKNIIGYYLNKLDGDQTITATVSFAINGKKYTDTVQSVIAQIENAAGDVYDLMCSNQSIGIDLNDDSETTKCNISFHINKMNNGVATAIPFSGTDYVFTKSTTVNVDQGINVQLLHTQSDLLTHGIENISISYSSDKTQLNLSFSVNEKKFNTFDLKFCLWVNGTIQDYGNIGMYANPKDGASYNIITNYDSFSVDSLGKMSKDTPNLTIRVDRILSGRVYNLTGASIDKGKINYDDKNAEFYFGYYNYGGTPATGGDFTDYYAKDTGEAAVDTITYDASTKTYSYNIYRNRYYVFGKNTNVAVADDGTVSLINKGFGISIYCKTESGFKLIGTKTIMASTPGAKGDSGESGTGGNTFKSIVFKRSKSKPNKPTGGSLQNPVPEGWSDGIPSGTDPIWASTRVFSSIAELQQPEWTEPYAVSDSDKIEFIFSSDVAPTTPKNIHPYVDDASWSKKADSSTIWMAISRYTNFAWSDWSIMKIKGEKGDTGEKGRDGVNGSQLRYLGTWNQTKCYCFQSCIAVKETLDNNTYKYDGKLYTDIAKPNELWSQNGIIYIDVVSIVKDGKERYFQATKNSCGVSPLTSSGNVNTGWEEAAHFGMLITDYMIAKVIDASKVSANEIIIKDTNNKIIGGMTNNISPTLPDKEEHLVFWTGSDGNDSVGKAGDSSKNAKFKVYDDGRISCTGINSEINGLATSTSEVVVELTDLPYVENDDGRYFYLDFTQYGPNILIKNTNTQITDELSNYSLAIDLPAYCFQGNVIKGNSSAAHAFSKLGIKESSSEYINAVYSYMNFVDKYKRTNVRIRANNISLPNPLRLRGCLTMQKTIGNQQSTGYNNPLTMVESYANLIDCSTGNAVDSVYTNTDSINNYYDMSYPYNTNQNSLIMSSNNNGTCIMDYPIYASSVYDESSSDSDDTVSFDLYFIPKVFSVNNQGSNIQNTASFSDVLSTMYRGVYWETHDVYHPASPEMIASTYDSAKKPSTYIK